MPSTKDIVLGKFFKALFVSKNGFGKTVEMASFHPKGTMWIADFDGRIDPIKLIYPDLDLRYDTYNSENYERFITDWNNKLADPSIKTMCIDSLTSWSMAVVKWKMQISGNANKIFSRGDKKDVYTPGWDEINCETDQITNILDDVVKGGKNFIVTAHPIDKVEIKVEGKTSTSERIRRLVAFGPKIESMVPNYFNEIYSFELSPPMQPSMPWGRTVCTVPKLDLGKSALGLPAYLDITNKHLYDVIRDHLKGKGIDF